MKRKPHKPAGGKRPGAGRKKGRPTTTVAFRIPKEYREQIVEAVRAKLEELFLQEAYAKINELTQEEITTTREGTITTLRISKDGGETWDDTTVGPI
jgi:hypothetical protein